MTDNNSQHKSLKDFLGENRQKSLDEILLSDKLTEEDENEFKLAAKRRGKIPYIIIAVATLALGAIFFINPWDNIPFFQTKDIHQIIKFLSQIIQMTLIQLPLNGGTMTMRFGQ